jgi:hypothetical protein
MAQDLFRVNKGLNIDGLSHYLQGSGAPNGGDADAAPQGSLYVDTATGFFYSKDTAGTGADKWVKQATQDDIDGVTGGGSWREPVLVVESTLRADVTAAETAANVADTVDGVTIASTDRILLANLTTGNENVYIVSGSTGAY